MSKENKKNLILACIANYKWDQIKIFFLSLGQTGFTGEVALFIENIDLETQKILKTLNYTVNLIPLTRVGLEYTFSIVDYRYYVYYNFMVNNETLYDFVFITDVRDVYFQSDPFKATWNYDFITIAKECCEISNEIYNTRWILSKFGYHTYCFLQDKTILCSGTTLGHLN